MLENNNQTVTKISSGEHEKDTPNYFVVIMIDGFNSLADKIVK